jgi:Flp pilus assembly protein TadD
VRLRAGLLALVIAGAAAYSNSLAAPFILDDEEAIVRNPHVVSLLPLSQAIGAPAQSSFAGRPVASLSLAISHAVGGPSPASFRAWNIAFLITSALALAALIGRTLRRAGQADAETFAVGVALLWLLHPLNTEVVNYVTQRTESLMGLCYLLTLYAAARAMDATRAARGWTAAAVVACAAGMATKESMVTAPLMVLIYDAVFAAGSIRAALTRRGVLYGGLASTWLLLAYLNLDGPRSGSAGFGTAVSPLAYLLNQAGMISTYLKLSVWPAPLIVDYGRTPPIDVGAAVPSLLLIGVLLAGVVFAWIRKHHVAAFLGTWFFVTLAPTSSVIPIATEVGAERRMYLPLIAIVTLAAIGIRRFTPHPRAMMGVTTVLALALGTATFARNRDYHDPIALWRQVVSERPHGRAHYNLAIALRAAGRVGEAIDHYRAAVADEPHAHYALGFEAGEAGRFDEAARELRAFLDLRPADPVAPQAWLLLGEALVRLQRVSEAERALRSALEMAPRFADAHGRLADLLLRQGRLGEAVAAYRSYLSLVPEHAAAHHGLGIALAMSGETGGAMNEFARAVSLDPQNAEFRMSLGTALASSGRLGEAIAEYRRALALAPSNARIMSALGVALSRSRSSAAHSNSRPRIRRSARTTPPRWRCCAASRPAVHTTGAIPRHRARCVV